MTETSAKGKKGYLLYSPFGRKEHGYFFRIYNSDGTFTDYDINCEELEIEILCDWVAFYENENGKKTLDWSSKALGRKDYSSTDQPEWRHAKQFQKKLNNLSPYTPGTWREWWNGLRKYVIPD